MPITDDLARSVHVESRTCVSTERADVDHPPVVVEEAVLRVSVGAANCRRPGRDC